MSGFIGWWEVMSAEEAVIEQEIKQIRELCRDMFKRIGRIEYWCGERIATDNTKEMLNELSGSLECVHVRIATMKIEAFDKHWKRNGDK